MDRNCPSAKNQMSQRLPWSIDDLEPDTRDAARRAARRAGMSVGEWLDMTMRDQDARGGHAGHHEDEYDESGLERGLSMMGRGRTETASHRFAPSRLSPDEAELLLAKAAAGDRRDRDADSRTAEMLESITRWMEKTESRLMASERNSSERQERTASVVADAIKTVGNRLNEVERRTGDERRAYPELRSAPDRRVAPRMPASPPPHGTNAFSKANFADAVAEIRARQRDLDGTSRPATRSRAEFADETGDPDIRALRDELRSLGTGFSERAARSAGQDDLRAELLRLRKDISQGAVRSNAEMMSTVSALITKLDRQPRGGDPIGRSIARLESDMAKLASGRGAGGEALERQIARLHQRLDQMGAVSDGKSISSLSRELSEIKTRLGDDLGSRIASMAGELTALRRAQLDPSELNFLRDSLQESRNAPARDAGSELGDVLRQIELLSGKIERMPVPDDSALDRKLDAIMQRIGENTPAGPVSSDALTGKIDALLIKLDDMPSRASPELEKRLDDLQALLERVPEKGSSALERQIETLAARLENLAASNGLVQVLASDGKPATADLRPIEKMLKNIQQKVDGFSEPVPAPAVDLSPIETMLREIQLRFETAQSPNAGHDAISALENQIARLASRFDEQPMATSDTGLDKTLRELVATVDAMRHEAPGSAERAVREALDNGLGQIKTSQSGMENRLQSSFSFVNDNMERIAARLEALEAGHVQEPGHVSGHVQERPARNEPSLQDMPARDAIARDPVIRDVLAEERASLADALLLEPAMAVAPARPKVMVNARKPADAVSMEAATRPEQRRIEPSLPAPPAPMHSATAPSALDMNLVDQPLEPGSGRPRGGAPVQPGSNAAPQGNDPQAIKANYIAAARRAVQAAAAEAQAASGDPRGPKDGKIPSPSKVKALFEKRKKPILLGLAAAIIALGSAQVISGVVFGGKAPGPEPKVSTATPEKAKPAPQLVQSGERSPQDRAPQDRLSAKPETATISALPEVSQSPAASQPAAAAPSATAMPAPAGASGIGPSALGPNAAMAAVPADVAAAASPAPLAGVAATVTGLPEIPVAIASPGLRKAAMSGDPRAVFDLATRAADGRGMPRDPKLALKLFERAAAAGLVPAQFRAGNMYEKGIGTAKDSGLARLWYERAAEKGNAKAMHNLAVLYAEGVTGKPDYPLAAEWFKKAADHGVRDSQYNLAILLARGLGAAQDLSQSYTWFAVAAAQGDEDAGKKRDEVALKLSPAELAAARTGVEQWRPRAAEPQANEVALPLKGWDEPVVSPAAPKKPVRNSQG